MKKERRTTTGQYCGKGRRVRPFRLYFGGKMRQGPYSFFNPMSTHFYFDSRPLTVKLQYGWLVGYLNDYPGHLTQGKDLAELEEMLVDLFTIRQEEKRLAQKRKTGILRIPA
jgi:hypothetical protein